MACAAPEVFRALGLLNFSAVLAGGCGVSRPDEAYWSTNDLAIVPPDGAISAAAYQALLDELAQAQTLEHERVGRIYHLEQALDQALACIEDLKLQVHDQAFLEAQLATTEEFAYVQQQAIARLKLQLNQQRQLLEAQASEGELRDQAAQSVLSATESIAQGQQDALEQLRSRIAQDQAEVYAHRRRLEKQLQDLQIALDSRQQRILELESESLTSRMTTASLEVQLAAAQQQIRNLCLSLSQHQTSLANLETQIANRGASGSVNSGATQLSLEPLMQTEMHQELAIAQGKVEELETQLDRLLKQQAIWQQNYQEVEGDRSSNQAKVEALERQAAEMQEQILQQARQAEEYETAVQHWKDRYTTNQNQLVQLRELLRTAIESGSTVASLWAAIEPLLPPTEEELPSPRTRFQAIDLPDFLVRRRAYRSKT
ncbi:MAG: hypothetical protein HC895_14395 [Leptolyngbyaceae cyanobacterium SM1_3_5]|nr:hypothetical protein [Leptolyngbyaceae cyanobacterium SM1_3_5]